MQVHVEINKLQVAYVSAASLAEVAIIFLDAWVNKYCRYCQKYVYDSVTEGGGSGHTRSLSDRSP